MKLPGISRVLLDQGDDEQIDVLRIRLWNSMKMSAVLSDFYNTDRVLAEWAKEGGRNGVQFEVRFVDGYVVTGYHVFFNKGKRQCTFCAHLRRRIAELAETRGGDMASSSVARYGIPTC